MSAAAQREDFTGQATGTDGAPASALRQLAAERLAAHRNRRAAAAAPPPPADIDVRMAQAAVRLQARRDAPQSSALPGSHPSVRDAVAARYRQSPSYREFLAAESERALQKAQAEAEVAARNAIAVAEAQRKLLDEIEQWNQPPEPLFVVEPPAPELAANPGAPHLASEMGVGDKAPRPRRQRTPEPLYAEPLAAADLKVQLYAALPPTAKLASAHPAVYGPASFDPEELEGLDQEIAFRLAPEFEDHIVATTPIQANIIEFPRQLVASRKARPRLAEGPLREDGTPEPQLRIFEVEPEQVSTEPAFVATAAPEWQSMVLAPALDAPIDTLRLQAHLMAQQDFDAAHNIAPQTAPEIHAAPVSRRIMAMAVDAVCVGAAFVAFVAATVKLCGPALRDLPRPELGIVAAIALVIFAALYQGLFFTLSEATPGMLYARIGLCTFAETNPSRRDVRRRLLATTVAICPVGLGLLWMALDSDRLGWHDRISRMYPRAY